VQSAGLLFAGLLLVLSAALDPSRAAAQSATPPDGGFADAQRTDGAMPVILPLRERAAVIDRWLEGRLETVASGIMRREGVDLWIVAAREYNEDPVIETMLPARSLAGGRRPVPILHGRGPGQEGFSEEVIQTGVTTTGGVVWWYRERIREVKRATWFQPSVSVQRHEKEGGSREGEGDFSSPPDENVIRPGDLLHVDFGITYLRLNTDTQQHAYVLKPGEDAAPAGLVRALAVGNRLQDILTKNFAAGRSGNEILAGALEQAKAEGIEATIYTHPIGFHGHGAGPTIGLWDNQDGVPGRGDYPLFPNTAHSIELNAAVPVPEWGGQTVRIMLEEDAFFDGERTWYIDGRQVGFWLIPR